MSKKWSLVAAVCDQYLARPQIRFMVSKKKVLHLLGHIVLELLENECVVKYVTYFNPGLLTLVIVHIV